MAAKTLWRGVAWRIAASWRKRGVSASAWLMALKRKSSAKASAGGGRRPHGGGGVESKTVTRGIASFGMKASLGMAKNGNGEKPSIAAKSALKMAALA